MWTPRSSWALASAGATSCSFRAAHNAPPRACFACALAERIPGGAIVEPGLRSDVEERWREAYQDAGSGEVEALRSADPELVQEDSAALAAALGRVFDRLEDGGRALVVGPTNEAAVLGFTGEIVEPMSKGAGVLVVLEDGQARVGSSFD